MGSALQKVRVPVNGTVQGMFLQGPARGAPVLLFVHGGPGMPEVWLTRRYPTRVAEVFRVAWWDQRGAGLSFDPRIRPESLHVEQFIADTLAVAAHLRDRHEGAPVYLLCHSWGSFVGVQAAARAPELFAAYIGMGQVVHQLRSEELAHQFLLAEYSRRGDTRMVRRLERAPVTVAGGMTPAYRAIRDRAMHQLGVGTTRDMRSVVTGLFVESLRFGGYTPGEKVALWRGKVRSARSPLWSELLDTDLTRTITELRLPAYFLHGAHDRTASYDLARGFAGTLTAPVIGFYTFTRSAHSPLFEQPEHAQRILVQDVLRGATSLADPPKGFPETPGA